MGARTAGSPKHRWRGGSCLIDNALSTAGQPIPSNEKQPQVSRRLFSIHGLAIVAGNFRRWAQIHFGALTSEAQPVVRRPETMALIEIRRSGSSESAACWRPAARSAISEALIFNRASVLLNVNPRGPTPATRPRQPPFGWMGNGRVAGVGRWGAKAGFRHQAKRNRADNPKWSEGNTLPPRWLRIPVSSTVHPGEVRI